MARINVMATGRGEAEKPVSEWPIKEGLELVDRELSGEVLAESTAARVKIGEVLQPAVILTDGTAIRINEAGSTANGVSFTPTGANKAKPTIYPSRWAGRKSRSLKADSMAGM